MSDFFIFIIKSFKIKNTWKKLNWHNIYKNGYFLRKIAKNLYKMQEIAQKFKKIWSFEEFS